MLTVRQLLVTSGQNSGDLHTNALPRQFVGRSLSLKSAIAAYEKQRRTYFVSLISPRIFLSNDVQTFEDLVRLAPGPQGQMTRDEMVALKADLEINHGILVRLVDKDFRHAALVGTVPALVSVPSVIVDGQNFVQIKDRYSGAEALGGIGVAVGLTMVGIGAGSFNPVLLIGGAFIFGLGAGFAGAAGVEDMKHDSPSVPEKPSPDKTKSELDSPDGQPDGDQDTIEIPNALAIGEPPNGFDVDKLLTDLGDFATDPTLSEALPVGWDPDSGEALIDLIGLGGEGDGAGDGGIDIPGIDIHI